MNAKDTLKSAIKKINRIKSINYEYRHVTEYPEEMYKVIHSRQSSLPLEAIVKLFGDLINRIDIDGEHSINGIDYSIINLAKAIIQD
jgi:hypothetical protein